MSTHNHSIVDVTIGERSIAIQTPTNEIETLNHSVKLLNQSMHKLKPSTLNFETRLILASLNAIHYLSQPSDTLKGNKKNIKNNALNEDLLIENNVFKVQLASLNIQLKDIQKQLKQHNSNVLSPKPTDKSTKNIKTVTQKDMQQEPQSLNHHQKDSRIERMIERCRSILV